MFEKSSEPILNLLTNLPADTGAPDAANPLTFILPLIAALVISMVIIPIVVRLAPKLGMVDQPGSRKVHEKPIPRVGGVGIVLGSLIPISLLLPIDAAMASFIFGGIVLFVFGALDDSRELGHYVKFIGQFIAVIGVVYVGDVYVTQLPFMGGEPVSEAIGRPFTVFAMVGMINAINHSDGLDGLAGGESLLSLCAIAYLAYLADGTDALIMALAIIGGLLGFIRFNTHPASIFMGDSGSQFLGYSLGFLAVLLTQEVNPVLSPALPALLLGLPIADIIAVVIQRIYHKMNWFRASRNHIHHRLLDLGFHHYESVVLIYSIQTLLVITAILVPYEADSLIAAIYLIVVATVFILLYLAERSGWRIHQDSIIMIDEFIESTIRSHTISSFAYLVVVFGLSLFLVAGSVIATRVPVDLAVVGLLLCALMVIRLAFGYRAWFLPLRLLSYMAIIFVVYLLNTYQPAYLSGADMVTYLFFGTLVLGIALMIRYTERGQFRTTPTDFLVIIAISILAVLSSQGIVDSGLTAIILKGIILFYGCELVLNQMKTRLNVFTLSVLFSLSVISVRGLFPYVV
ncbi:MAG: MraY family glycosyltransferase [Gammaproteobacteria bacterium]